MRALHRVPPVIWLLAAGLAQHFLAGTAWHSLAEGVAGAVLGVPSVALAVWAVVVFRRHHTTVDPLHVDRARALVSDGPFAYTRNPMYLAMAGLLVAHAVALSSWIALLAVPVFMLVIDRGQIAVEEAAMRAEFGADFAAYCTRVPRWVGMPHIS